MLYTFETETGFRVTVDAADEELARRKAAAQLNKGRRELSDILHEDDLSRVLTVQEYLRDLAERLRHVPATYGVDGGDVDRLGYIAVDMSGVSFGPLEFEGGKLVKVGGRRHNYMSGDDLIRLVAELAEKSQATD